MLEFFAGMAVMFIIYTAGVWLFVWWTDPPPIDYMGDCEIYTPTREYEKLPRITELAEIKQ